MGPNWKCRVFICTQKNIKHLVTACLAVFGIACWFLVVSWSYHNTASCELLNFLDLLDHGLLVVRKCLKPEAKRIISSHMSSLLGIPPYAKPWSYSFLPSVSVALALSASTKFSHLLLFSQAPQISTLPLMRITDPQPSMCIVLTGNAPGPLMLKADSSSD